MNTKLNTIFKTSILALAVLVIAFMFSACGGSGQFSNVKVDTKGDYQESDIDTVNALLAEQPEDEGEPAETVVSGLRFTMTMSIPMVDPENPSQTITQETDYNMLFKTTETATETKIEMAMKMAGEAAGQKQSATIYFINTMPAEGESTQELYADINMVSGTETIKGKYNFSTENSMGEMLMMTAEMLYSMVEMMGPAGGQLVVNTNEFAVATSGDTTKIRITVPGETEEENGLIYYILENGKFSAMKIENFTTDVGGTEMTLNVSMENWAGDIDYPNFDKYVEFVDQETPSIA